jgi:hypothetical protein
MGVPLCAIATHALGATSASEDRQEHAIFFGAPIVFQNAVRV